MDYKTVQADGAISEYYPGMMILALNPACYPIQSVIYETAKGVADSTELIQHDEETDQYGSFVLMITDTGSVERLSEEEETVIFESFSNILYTQGSVENLKDILFIEDCPDIRLVVRVSDIEHIMTMEDAEEMSELAKKYDFVFLQIAEVGQKQTDEDVGQLLEGFAPYFSFRHIIY